MKIRRARKEDAREISKLRIKTIKKINYKDYSKQFLENLIKLNSIKNIEKNLQEREMFCLTGEDKILGVIDLKENKIGGLFVDYRNIRKGYGKKLLNFIEKRAKRKKLKKVILYPTPSAEEFYKKQGYKFSDKKFYQTIISGNKKTKMPRMEKKLR